MSIKITIPNSSSDVLTFGSGNTPTAAQIAGIDSGSSNGQLALYTTASGTSTERVRVDSSGNVVIGDTSTSGKFKVAVADDASFQTAGNFTNNINADFKIRVKSSVTDLGPSTSTPLTFSIGGSERMRIDSAGNFLVGTTNASASAGLGWKVNNTDTNNAYTANVFASTTGAYTTHHLYSTGAAAYRFYVGGAGTVFATTTTISSLSDARLKENIRDLDDGLEKVMALQPRKFDWKEGKGQNIKDARGFVAQEFETVFPDMIDEWKDPAPEGEEPYKSVNANLIPTLVKAIQEQQAIITSLTDRITALEGATS